MKNAETLKITIVLFIALNTLGCKQEFLDVKPKSNLVTLTTLDDYKSLLENLKVCNVTTALPQISADEYFILSQEVLNSLYVVPQRNAYTWETDLYEGTVPIKDWSDQYAAILCANSVLDGLESKIWSNTDEVLKLQGRALFIRAHSHFNLLQTFAPAYDKQTADSDLGIPLRLSSDITQIQKRASVSDCYAQIIKDLKKAAAQLQEELPNTHRYRPSKVAAMALFARIYLNMRDYEKAENYADSCLALYDELQDYNTINENVETPFPYDAKEVIYHTRQVEAYSSTTGYWSQMDTYIGIDTNLISLYDEDDLRLNVFYIPTDAGYHNPKKGYIGAGLYPFTGLATDEIYLIKAECAARRNDPTTALEYLNRLLKKRYKTGTFIPIESTESLLDRIKEERRKELVWRGLRWFDIIRYNKEGANITLERNIGGKHYELPPNSPLYVFPIPEDDINLGGLTQNPR